MTAATICATSRVRLAPIIRNSAMVSASAARGRDRAHGGDDAIGGKPAASAQHGQHIDEGRRQQDGNCYGGTGNAAHAHREHFSRASGRREDEIEIRARICDKSSDQDSNREPVMKVDVSDARSAFA